MHAPLSKLALLPPSEFGLEHRLVFATHARLQVLSKHAAKGDRAVLDIPGVLLTACANWDGANTDDDRRRARNWHPKHPQNLELRRVFQAPFHMRRGRGVVGTASIEAHVMPSLIVAGYKLWGAEVYETFDEPSLGSTMPCPVLRKAERFGQVTNIDSHAKAAVRREHESLTLDALRSVPGSAVVELESAQRSLGNLGDTRDHSVVHRLNRDPVLIGKAGNSPSRMGRTLLVGVKLLSHSSECDLLLIGLQECIVDNLCLVPRHVPCKTIRVQQTPQIRR